MLIAPLKSSDVRSRVDPELKVSAALVLAQCGLSLSDGIRLFLRQVVVQQGLPFEVNIPNDLTIVAMKEARGIRQGRFNSAQELIDGLEKNSTSKAR